MSRAGLTQPAAVPDRYGLNQAPVGSGVLLLYRVCVRVEVWSDVVCPWCYVGKRRLESALERFEHRDEVEVVWRSFELDPNAPRRRELSAAEHLGRKYGISGEQVAASWVRLTALAEAEGLEFHLDRSIGGSTFDAHRLIHLGVEFRPRPVVRMAV